jgi:hypothetical protein
MQDAAGKRGMKYNAVLITGTSRHTWGCDIVTRNFPDTWTKMEKGSLRYPPFVLEGGSQDISPTQF